MPGIIRAELHPALGGRRVPSSAVTEMDHINQLIDGTDRAVAHYRDLYGSQIEEVFASASGPTTTSFSRWAQ